MCIKRIARSVALTALCLNIVACGVGEVDPQDLAAANEQSSATTPVEESSSHATPPVTQGAGNGAGGTGGGSATGGGSSSGGSGGGSTAFVLRPDSARTESAIPVSIDVLANDTYSGSYTIEIASAPANGSVVVNGDDTLAYTSSTGFVGTDSFTYRVVDGAGNLYLASVSVTVDCTAPCTTTSSAAVRISWDRNTEPDVTGYYLYHGTASGQYSDVVWVDNVVSYDYTITGSGTHYFAVTAVNSAGVESPYSSEVSVVN